MCVMHNVQFIFQVGQGMTGGMKCKVSIVSLESILRNKENLKLIKQNQRLVEHLLKGADIIVDNKL